MSEEKVDPGCVLRFRSGESVQVTERFTSAIRYLRQAAEGGTRVEDVNPDTKEKRMIFPDAQLFTKSDGSGRLWVAPEEARFVVVEELKS